MRAVVQRVKHAKVSVGGKTTGEIDQGLLIFLLSCGKVWMLNLILQKDLL